MDVTIIDNSTGTELARVTLSVIPREGETLYVELFAGRNNYESAFAPMFFSRVRLLVVRADWYAFNSNALEPWFVPFRAGKDAYVELIVSPDDDRARTWVARRTGAGEEGENG